MPRLYSLYFPKGSSKPWKELHILFSWTDNCDCCKKAHVNLRNIHTGEKVYCVYIDDYEQVETSEEFRIIQAGFAG